MSDRIKALSSRSISVENVPLTSNCLILGRAESFAYNNGVFDSLLDGLGMGLGFALALTILGSVREILGAGSIFGVSLFSANFQPVLMMILPPGAFLALGILMAINNKYKSSRV